MYTTTVALLSSLVTAVSTYAAPQPKEQKQIVKAALPVVKESKETVIPTVTLSEIRAAIPDSCFQPNVPLSLYYALRDLVFAATFLYFRAYLPGPLYWLAQGTMFWGIFVIGHDCGHQAFSKSSKLNDVVGTFMHALILTPYTSWKLTHRHHHAHTGNVDKDETFVPWRNDEEFSQVKKTAKLGFFYGFGWIIYLFQGMAHPVCHFNPMDKRFKGHRMGVLASTLSCIAMAVAVVTYAVKYTNDPIVWVLDRYVAPILVFGTWLVMTTFLHHQDDDVIWYDNADWNYVRGQLSTVDRNLGWFLNNITHDITTHQIHHLFPRMPHYNLVEATAHFRKAFPSCVRLSEAGFFSEFVRLTHLYSDNGHVQNLPCTLGKNAVVKKTD